MASRAGRAEGPPLPADLDVQLRRALSEDRVARDRTSRAVIPARCRGVARFVAQSNGTLSGSRVAMRLARLTGLLVSRRLHDGSPVRPGLVVLELRGNLRAILGVERTILNYLMHLSGVATATRAAVRAAGGKVDVLATRKTLPGLRDLEKAAVVHGGGRPHRRDLSDAMLLKRPHLKAVGLGPAVRRAIRGAGDRIPVEVEVRTLAEAREALDAGARRLLLDNVGPLGAGRIVSGLVRAGRRRGVVIEASGGITPANVGAYRRSGVDAVSLGSLTHSAPALPFHLLLD
ncbi:MAG TPA: carboxylating nicotinate-nucleotide diphosphorylase [Thermoplasmata archaeon]|nr:carboxylating nicotinate-nucleotide diphosphorylase [Thermoplasmata archaeon]